MSDKDNKGEPTTICPLCIVDMDYIYGDGEGGDSCYWCPKCGFLHIYAEGQEDNRTPKARPITHKEEWISVKERLPKIGEEVFIWWGEREVGYLDTYDSFNGKDKRKIWRPHYDRDRGYPNEVTHWMPLPSPPTKDQTEKEGE